MRRKETFYIVWCPDGSEPPRKRHTTWGGASDEAVRLAKAVPGKDFFVMAASRRVCAPKPIEIEDFDTEIEIPF